MATPDWDLTQVQKFYGEFAEKYDSDVSPDTYPAPFIIGKWTLAHLQSHSSVLSTAEHAHPKRFCVLDLGCGTGQSSKAFFAPPSGMICEVYGTDATPEMLKKAKSLPFQSLALQPAEAPLPFEVVFDAV
ncbi:hypothetical protein BDK51DRAFT_25497, partial [Blyttiomyces helicus]